MRHESGGVMREPRNTQNTRKNGEVESGGVWSGGVESFPTNWPVFTVVGNAPGAGLGGD